LNPFVASRDQPDERPQEPQTGAKEKARKFRRSISPPERRVVIGACAPIHPRVGPAVRPDVRIRVDPLFLLENFEFSGF
jgi:hypothetical protein